MDENINESVETQEVAEPETEALEESAETQEVAEPVPEAEDSHEEERSGRTEADARFAEMRRQNQQLERDNQLMRDALLRYFDGETAEELSINANAYAEEKDPEEYRVEWEHNQEFSRLQQENEELQSRLIDAEVDRLMREGLRDVREIDPNIKNLDELGESFAKFIGAGLSAKEAYYASKSMELNEKTFAPSAIGRVSDSKAERDYYTSEELDQLTDEEMDENWDKVMRSLNRL